MEMIGFDGLDVRVRERENAEMPPWCLVCKAAGAAVPFPEMMKVEKNKLCCIYVGSLVGAH